MATFYLDPEGGNDANAGTSFALRWKTLTSGATAARIAPGDTIRIMASRDAGSIGNGTWTDNSNTLTLAAAKTLTVWNGDEAWTAVSANITGSTATTYRKIGTTCATIAGQAAFTTGKAGYKTLGAALDLSAYEQIGFWVLTSSANSFWELRLCSDTIGDTAVHTIPITTAVANQWVYVLFDNAAALGATINSVAVYAASDPSTTNIRVQNIIACKAKTSSDCLTGLSLVGKNSVGEPEWYPIQSIDGTTVVLGGHFRLGLGSSDETATTYRGTGETVTTYSLNPIPLPTADAASTRIIQDSGTLAGGNITFSGGWDRTDMSTQTGETHWSGRHFHATGIDFANTEFLSFEKISLHHFYNQAIDHTPSARSRTGPITYSCEAMCGNSTGILATEVNDGGWPLEFTVNRMVNNRVHFDVSAEDFKLTATRITGGSYNTGAASCGFLYGGAKPMLLDIGKYDNSAGAAIQTFQGNYGCGAPIIVRGTTFQNNGSDFTNNSSTSTAGGRDVRFVKCEFLSTNKIVRTNLTATHRIYCHNYDKTANDHRIYSRYWYAKTDSSVRHTASGISWALYPEDATNCNQHLPAEIELAKFAFAAGTLVTVKCWARRSNTGLTIGIKVPGGYIAGVPSDLTDTVTAVADTWEELSVTFTPTESGVLELWGYAYGGSTYVGYFDDLTITQA